MYLETDKNINRNNEEKMIKQSICELSNLFSDEKFHRAVKKIKNGTHKVEVSYDKDAKRGDLNAKINDYDIYDVNYSIGDNPKDNEFNRIKSFAHVLLASRNDKSEFYIHNRSAVGPCHYDAKENKYYGKSLAHGTGNVMAKMAMIKQNCPDLMEGYLETGLFDTEDEDYSFSEEMARLLTLASIDSHKRTAVTIYAKALNSEDGLDNKVIKSTFLNSAVKNNFEFEREYNLLSKGTYKDLCDEIDEIEDKYLEDGSYDPEMVNDCINQIRDYHGNKVFTLNARRLMSDETMRDSNEKFESYVTSSKYGLVKSRGRVLTKHQ